MCSPSEAEAVLKKSTWDPPNHSSFRSWSASVWAGVYPLEGAQLLYELYYISLSQLYIEGSVPLPVLSVSKGNWCSVCSC